MPRLRQNDRERAVGMVQTGMTHQAVADHFNVSTMTISRLMIRLRQTGRTNDRPRSRVWRHNVYRNLRLIHLSSKLFKEHWMPWNTETIFLILSFCPFCNSETLITSFNMTMQDVTWLVFVKIFWTRITSVFFLGRHYHWICHQLNIYLNFKKKSSFFNAVFFFFFWCKMTMFISYLWVNTENRLFLWKKRLDIWKIYTIYIFHLIFTCLIFYLNWFLNYFQLYMHSW
jgi:hypothetical protein